MRSLVLAILIATAGSVCADEPSKDSTRTSIERGVAFLATDALKWKADHNCASCHHAGMVAWALNDAQKAGFAIDTKTRDEMQAWMVAAGDGKTGVARPKETPKALNTKPLYYALALQSAPEPGPEVAVSISRFLQTIRDDQLEDGHWDAWIDTRPPMFGPSNNSMSGLATLALLPAAANDEPARLARDRAVNWLNATPTDRELQSLVLRLLIWKRLERPESEQQALIDSIVKLQRADGGFGQTSDLSSDAFATGQTLYALCEIDHPPEEAIARAVAFLVGQQQPDGAWPMKSRPTKEGGEGSKNLIPIIGTGSAWAVLGLVKNEARKAARR